MIGLLGIALVAVALLLFYVTRSRNKQKGDQSPRQGQRSESAGEERYTGRSAAELGRGKTVSFPTRNLPMDLARRKALLDAIHTARARRTGWTGPTPEDRGSDPFDPLESPPLKPGFLEKEYVRERVREVVPLVKECYELALHHNPGMGGKIVVEFVMGGEPEVGGVIERSDILETSGLPDKTILTECVRETMYAIEFDPPPEGGRVTVRYPFQFRSAKQD